MLETEFLMMIVQSRGYGSYAGRDSRIRGDRGVIECFGSNVINIWSNVMEILFLRGRISRSLVFLMIIIDILQRCMCI